MNNSDTILDERMQSKIPFPFFQYFPDLQIEIE